MSRVARGVVASARGAHMSRPFIWAAQLLRRRRFALFVAVMLAAAVAVYNEMVAVNTWICYTGPKAHDKVTFIGRRAISESQVQAHQPSIPVEDSALRNFTFVPQPWKPKYMGRVNLHVFQDWCGGSTTHLRNDLLFPLFPHTRTTVPRLAVSPSATNYGLRIFGYLHPFVDGEFVFAVSSDDNSELWLSSDDSPSNLHLLSWVGKSGAEWTAPGEFQKYQSQTSRPVRLSAEKKYYFEVIHKQDDVGTDHVEVGWRIHGTGSRFVVIGSKFISMYVDESALLPSHVTHIPQTAASRAYANQSTADMLTEDPRDLLHQMPLMNSKFLRNVLPKCLNKLNGTAKDSKILRYEGFQLVHLSFVYPNDYTRLTHMETVKSCFYPRDLYNLEKYGFTGFIRPYLSELQEEKIPDLKKSATGDHNNKALINELFQLDEKVGADRMAAAAALISADYDTDYAEYEETFRQRLVNLPLLQHQPAAHSRSMGKRAVEEKKKKKVEEKKKEEEKKKKGEEVVEEEKVMKWDRTFRVNRALDLRSQRTDKIEMRCRVNGNLMLNSREARTVVDAFVAKLNEKHSGQFTLVQTVNVERRADLNRASRYFLELLLKDADGRLLRVSQHVYAEIPQPELLLCSPPGFSWNPSATVNIIVPVKNQARWVMYLIAQMEKLFRATGDDNLNLIVIDYNSEDMDVEQALRNSKLHRYQFKKLYGNFERSGGLQAGIDLIKDQHSIAFLCDLHIYFPISLVDIIRKHCVEGHAVFAPIVMRLDCGATPLDAKGLWEVQGFGLIGMYKSDLDAIGGMNTVEFKDRWGGEDWELLDRIMEAGLEVERLYVRNFFHFYHSRRGMWGD